MEADDDFDHCVGELASALGISKAKAERVAHAIRMLYCSEMEKSSPKVSISIGG